VELLLDAGGHRKKLLNKDEASESMVHNYIYVYVCIFYIFKKGGIITTYMYV